MPVVIEILQLSAIGRTLPKLVLYKAAGVTSPAVDALHDYLAHYVGLSSSSIDEAQRPLAKPPPNEPARKPEPPPRRRPSLIHPKSS